MSDDIKIDFVVTWVNGSDDRWIEKKNRYQKLAQPNKLVNNAERFREFGTLENWVKRVQKYAPWVNNVFIVTDDQDLGFELTDKRFRHVKHHDFIEDKYLPLFNSNAIEMNLDKIESLEEHFVLFNDDQYLNNYVEKTDFFSKNGLPVEVGYMTVFPASNVFYHTVLNNLIYINKKFNKRSCVGKHLKKYTPISDLKATFKTLSSIPWTEFTGWQDEHLTTSHLKSTFKEVYDAYPDLRHEQSSRRFRGFEDNSHWLFKYWNLAQGKFKPRKPGKFGEFLILAPLQTKSDIERVFDSGKKVICINDEDMSDVEANRLKQIVEYALSRDV